jgi:hypothetical protein
MKKILLNSVVIVLAISFIACGCEEGHYYRENHHHSPDYDNRHHHDDDHHDNDHVGVGVDIHN